MRRNRMTARRLPVLLPIVFVFAMSLVMSARSFGAEQQGFAFEASVGQGSVSTKDNYFKFEAGAGDAVEQHVQLHNATDKAIAVSLAPLDGTAAVYGGVAYSDSSKRPALAGAWIDLADTTVELEPGGSVTVPFTVAVPTDVTSGVHVAGIAVWEPSDSSSSEPGGSEGGASMRVTTVTRLVLPVVITTPGREAAHLVITGVKPQARSDGMYLLVGIKNDGTGIAGGRGRIKLPDEGFQAQIELGDLVPESATEYPVRWREEPPEGTYPSQVDLSYADGTETATWSGDVTVSGDDTQQLADTFVASGDEQTGAAGTPWLLYGLVGGLIIIIGLLLLLLLRRRPAPKA